MGLLNSLFGKKASAQPELIAINHDKHQARYIGFTGDGRQFMLTTPFVPGESGAAGREFVALYLFDASGRLIEARIDYVGQQAVLDPVQSRQVCEAHLAGLGPYSFCRIEICPFRVERFGVVFGLIKHPPQTAKEEWYVTLEPGPSMYFYEPWESGDYET
jgi:hypothetical protein